MAVKMNLRIITKNHGAKSSRKIYFKVQWLRNSQVDSVGVKLFLTKVKSKIEFKDLNAS